jgi:hypothetical protein
LFFILRVVVFLALILAVVIAVLARDGPDRAADSTPAPPSPVSGAPLAAEEAALAVLRENAAAIVARDLDRYVATLDESAPAYETTVDTMRALLDSYTLEVVLEEAEVLEQTDDRIVIRLVQTTRKISGLDFADNKRTVIHILRLVDGAWKIYASDIVSTEYLS